MSGEHEDHDNETREGEPHVAEAERTGRPDDESGPRVSAHPVVEDFSDSYPEDDEQRGQAHQHRSGPPPKPRLKDSKYPPPAASADASAPPPRKKVISSPDLPPARPRTPPPDAGSDPELVAAVVPRAPARPHDMLGDGPLAPSVSVSVGGDAARAPSVPPAPSPPLRGRTPPEASGARPPGASPPRQRMATLREEIDDDVRAAHASSDERVILPPPTATSGAAAASAPNAAAPPAKVIEPPAPTARLIEPPAPTARLIEPPAPTARVIEPPSPSAPRVIAPSAASDPPSAAAPPSAASTPPSRLVPPPKPERREEYVATYSRAPSLKPPPLPPSAERVVVSQPLAAPPVAVPPVAVPPVAAPPAAAPPAAAPPAAAPPTAAPPVAVPSLATTMKAVSPFAAPAADAPPVAVAPPAPPVAPVAAPTPVAPPVAAGGAATSYPPPSNPPPPVKSDSIAVHAIRVINIGVDDTTPTEGLRPSPSRARADGDDFENIEDYTEEEFEPPPDSLDEADVQALTEDELKPSAPAPVSTEGAPPTSGEVKLPPPPKRPAPAPPKKKTPRAPARKRPWWEEVFSEDFMRATHHLSNRHIKREADFIDHSLGVAQGAVVLDLACGTGQHSIELASRGYSVVGYDLSVYQLAIAGETAQERELKINFLQGDMREMAFQEMFDGIFCWNTSFGYFEEEKNVAVAERIFQALRPGGMFLIDVVNRDHVMQHQPSQVWFQGDACVCMDDMSVDYITSRLRVKRSIIMDDGRTRECAYSIRLYTLHELGKLLHEVGFRVIEASGHPTTPGVYLGPNSPRVIILAQRP